MKNLILVGLLACAGNLLATAMPTRQASPTDKFRLFMEAIYDGEIALVRYFLQDGLKEELHRTDRRHHTPLMAAANENHPAIIELLLAAGADVNFINENGWTALTEAADEGSYAAAKALLAAGADPAGGGRASAPTPLAMAASEGHPELIRLLLEAGAPLERPDGHVQALHLAAAERQVAVARLLLERGAVVDSKDHEGRTPLAYAAAEGATEVAGLLLEAGANPRAADDHGRTPLEYAAEEGAVAIVDRLLDAMGPAQTASLRPQVLLGAANEGELAIVRRLVEAGVDVDGTDAEGNTALGQAAHEGEEAVVRYLLERGAAVDGPAGSAACTPLLHAAHENATEVVLLLLEAGADPEASCDFREFNNHRTRGRAGAEIALYTNATPLLAAVVEESRGSLRALLAAGANVNARATKELLTSPKELDYRIFYESGSDAWRDHLSTTYVAAGWTPLMEAVETGDAHLVELLLAAGADRTAATAAGLTVRQIAQRRGLSAIVRLLD